MILAPLLLRLAPYAIALAAFAGYSAWFYHAGAESQRDKQARALVAAERQHAADLAAATKTVTVEVTKYVDRIEQLPGRTVVRDRIVNRLCNPSPADVRAADDTGLSADAGTDAGNRPADALADDLIAAQVNKARQAALIETVKGIYAANGAVP